MTPGYQFTQQQGNLAIQRMAAANGGFSGGTLRSADRFNTNLANTTYNDVFNRALSGYNAQLAGYGAGLQGYMGSNQAANQNYAAQLAGYDTGMQAQQQEFGQMFAPAQLGEMATSNLNQSGQQAATSVNQLMGGIGNAGAAGTIGGANAINQGIGGFANSISSGFLLNSLLGGAQGGGSSVSDWINPIAGAGDISGIVGQGGFNTVPVAPPPVSAPPVPISPQTPH
jgi:hypothetical protein